MTTQDLTPDEWASAREAWTALVDRAEGFPLGSGNDTAAQAATKEGWQILARHPDGDILASTNREGLRLMLVKEVVGPWAVDVTDALPFFLQRIPAPQSASADSPALAFVDQHDAIIQVRTHHDRGECKFPLPGCLVTAYDGIIFDIASEDPVFQGGPLPTVLSNDELVRAAAQRAYEIRRRDTMPEDSQDRTWWLVAIGAEASLCGQTLQFREWMLENEAVYPKTLPGTMTMASVSLGFLKLADAYTYLYLGAGTLDRRAETFQTLASQAVKIVRGGHKSTFIGSMLSGQPRMVFASDGMRLWAEASEKFGLALRQNHERVEAKPMLDDFRAAAGQFAQIGDGAAVFTLNLLAVFALRSLIHRGSLS